MKSDNSRNTFDPRKRYSGVIMQQGRVQLDADWNEQLAIQQHRTEIEASDVIGSCGVPEKGGGFDINFTPDYSDLTISAGRIYVDGLLSENIVESRVPFIFVGANQVQVDSISVDGREFRKGEWVELPHGDGHKDDKMFQIVAVDVDKQLLTLRVDEKLFKLSDHQQAKVPHLRRIMTYTTQPDYPNPGFAIHTSDADLSQLDLHADHFLLLIYLDVWERHITALDDPAIREVALGGPDTTTRIQNVAQVRLLPIQIEQEFKRVVEARKDASKKEEKAAYDEAIKNFGRSLTGNSAFSEWEERIQPSTGKLEVRLQPTPPGISAYQHLENQLYRVEIQSNQTGQKQFKWSRDNGSVATAIKEIKGNTVLVQGVGPNSILDFQRGQWIEITSDLNELKSPRAGHETKISDVDSVSGALVLEEAPPAIEPRWHPKLLRWDGVEDFQPGENWFELEGGIEIRFSEGTYKPGDYWQIPARTATGTVEWPDTLPQPPRGVKHHFTRLALVHLYQDKPEVQDCRRKFPPIASHAMHVLETSWINDRQYGRDILKEGLRITLDTDPDPHSISSATLIVSVETSLPGGGDGLFIMNGAITVVDNNIYWQWRDKEEGSIAEFLDKINILRRGHSLHPLVRVTLKGHHIWGAYDGRRIHLDGQTFSEPGTLADDREPRNALSFPSGGGAKAHDFESWFYLAEL